METNLETSQLSPKEKNIFEKIRDGEAQATIVYQDKWVTGFLDIQPDAPVHILLIPNKKIVSLQELEEDDAHYIAKIMLVAKNLAVKYGIADTGYRIITNCGTDGGQEVPYLHFHLVGGLKLGKMISLPKESKKLFKNKITKTMV